MPRPFVVVLAVIGGLLLVVALIGAAAGWLAYGTSAPRTGTLAIAGVDAPVTLAWPDSGGVVVEARTLSDAAAGLGYAHAADHAWSMGWLRQSARGEASAWAGTDAGEADRQARRLGFADTARDTYRALPPAERALLDAYAAGVNLALDQPGVSEATPFIVAGVAPEPWAPWDALAVERLLAWVGTGAPATDSTWAPARAASPEVRAFAAADSALRASVALGHASAGRVFAAPTDDGLTHVQHHVTGTSAEALFVPVVLRVGGSGAVALTVPGTLLAAGGLRPDGAWGMLLTSRAAAEPHSGALPPPVHSRLVDARGRERLVAMRRDSAALVVGRVTRRAPAPVAPPARPDTASAPASTPPAAPVAPGPVVSGTTAADTSAVQRIATGLWRIVWPGFAPVADGPALFRFAAGGGTFPVTRLFAGTGLVLDNQGQMSVLGRLVWCFAGPTRRWSPTTARRRRRVPAWPPSSSAACRPAPSPAMR